jgi:predicted AlkP superfamily phosphohydrolase/phosphomutase
MSSEKVFILGLDGASPEVIESLIDLGQLPAFEKLKKDGVMGKLRTTIPPITGSAWSSFMTGKNPGKHGIFDFITRKEGTYHLAPINSNLREGRSFWSRASDAGKKVCIINVPITYPPEKVNGVMVSGMLTPRGRTDYTQPPSLARELDRVTRGYRIHMEESFSKGREETFLKHLYEVTEKRIEAMEYLFKREDWDLFVGIIEGIDLIQHELWHCWDPAHFRHPSPSGKYVDVIPSFYRKMDEFLNRILEEWIDSRWTIIVMSDHGAGPLKKLFYINNFLMRKGFLKLKGGARSSIKHLLFQAGFVPMTFYHLLLRMGLGRLKKMARFGQGESWLKPFFLSFEDVEWSRTRAYSFGSTAGQIYLNLKGREPLGIVSPGKEEEEVRKEIIRELQRLVDEETGEQVVGEIYRKEDLYHGPHLKDAPDIVFLPKTLEIAAFGEYEFASHRMIDYSWGVSGSHRMDGLITMKGKPFRQGTTLQGARIIDLAPSVLYLLGLPVPGAMDGEVLRQAFLETAFEERPVRVIDEKTSPDSLPEEIYSDEEEEELKRRLKTLGYFT